jgi:hypothetical protein
MMEILGVREIGRALPKRTRRTLLSISAVISRITTAAIPEIKMVSFVVENGLD